MVQHSFFFVLLTKAVHTELQRQIKERNIQRQTRQLYSQTPCIKRTLVRPFPEGVRLIQA